MARSGRRCRNDFQRVSNRSATATVEADSEEEAIEKAIETVHLDDVENWEALKEFNMGNVCFCPRPWEAEATCEDLNFDEDEEDE